MGEVAITINDRVYKMACDDGQEARLEELAGRLNSKVGELVTTVGQVGDARLLVMAGLLLSDELSDLRAEVESLRAGRPAATGGGGDQGAIAERLDAMSRRIESVADAIESA